MILTKIKEKVNKLPEEPGVYIFKDKSGGIIYIGKATNLKNRVGSYFNGGTKTNRPIEAMIGRVENISFQQTDSVLEALILESNLIKKYQPKYNVKEKDDKSFSYIVLTEEEFPKFLILRKTDLKTKNYKLKTVFGPYTSKKQLEIALKILRKIFPYHNLPQKSEKGCLDFQIGLCSGPYAGGITKADYSKNIRGIQMILEGRKKSLVRKLEKKMQEYAKKHEFEKAAELRNKIFALKHIQDVALISSGDENSKFEIRNSKFRIEAYDISNISGQYATGSMVVFNNKEPDKSQYRKFKIKTVEGSNDVGMMAEVLFRRFKNDWSKPDLILLDGGKGHLNMAEKVLKELNLKIPMVAVAKGPTRKIPNFKFLISNQSPIPNELKYILENKNLIGRISNEAHRFAIGYHKKLRKKGLIS